MEGFEVRDVLVEWREVGRENTLETGGQVFLPPHLPQAEHTVFTAQKLHKHKNIPHMNVNYVLMFFKTKSTQERCILTLTH